MGASTTEHTYSRGLTIITTRFLARETRCCLFPRKPRQRQCDSWSPWSARAGILVARLLRP